MKKEKDLINLDDVDFNKLTKVELVNIINNLQVDIRYYKQKIGFLSTQLKRYEKKRKLFF